MCVSPYAVLTYVKGIDDVNPRDEQLLLKAHALRQAMEAVYGQRIAFKGEPGPPSRWHCCIEAEGVVELQRSGGPSLYRGR